MVKVAPKVNTSVLLAPPKDPILIAPRPAQKQKLEEESEEEKTDEERDNDNENEIGSGPGTTNRMVRRPRTHLSCLQLSILQSCYETCAHPNAMECEAIGTELNLPLKVVQIWFQNTRAKEKRWRLQQEKMVSGLRPVFYCKFSHTSNRCVYSCMPVLMII
uniref:Homeobox domain-containing protein n=1 Tax=Echeneis naucrates TaxID=173247 RepID=A0A665X432_ECHNA